MIEIEGVKIGRDFPCRFIAEISNNHNGEQTRAAALVEAAVLAGADFVKFQAFTVDELVALRGNGPAPDPWGSQGWRMAALYHKAKTPLEWLPTLFALTRGLGAVPFASVFGPESLAAVLALDAPALKVAALDVGTDFVDEVRQCDEVLIASTHGTERLGWADLTLHCPEGYPQNPNEIDHDNFGTTFDGLSYHGTSMIPPLTAALHGAQLIECHFQLEAEPSELEANVSLDELTFRRMVDACREQRR